MVGFWQGFEKGAKKKQEPHMGRDAATGAQIGFFGPFMTALAGMGVAHAFPGIDSTKGFKAALTPLKVLGDVMDMVPDKPKILKPLASVVGPALFGAAIGAGIGKARDISEKRASFVRSKVREEVPPIMGRTISQAGSKLADLTVESDRGKFRTFKG